MKLNKLKNKRILILGFGREGRDNFLFLRKVFPKKVIGIADKERQTVKSKKVKLHFGEKYLESIKGYDVIVKSPGIPPRLITPFIKKKEITSQTDIFFENCPGKIIGITGTKGKSTTASMIYKILKRGGIKAHLIGNIGKPVLSSLLKAREDDVFIYELSSHQLYNIKQSPQIAVLLNIYPEHLDYYRNLREYAKAKANIALYQKKKDSLVFNSGDKLVKEIVRKSKAKKIPVQGKYYSLDREAAKAVGEILKIPAKIITKALSRFKYLSHRLELVGKFKGITFYNDALATIPEATIYAMEALGKRVETIMLGGFERNIDFKKLAKKVLERKIRNVILFPTTGRRIWQEIFKISKGRGLPRHFFVDNMKEAVKKAYEHTGKGKICLLSTASPSFGIFRDYEEKGNLFKKYAKKFGHEKSI